jgi:hypothetical protein
MAAATPKGTTTDTEVVSHAPTARRPRRPWSSAANARQNGRSDADSRTAVPERMPIAHHGNHAVVADAPRRTTAAIESTDHPRSRGSGGDGRTPNRNQTAPVSRNQRPSSPATSAPTMPTTSIERATITRDAVAAIPPTTRADRLPLRRSAGVDGEAA